MKRLTAPSFRVNVAPMTPASRRLASRIAVLVPTVVMSIYLGHRGVPVGPRIMLTLMFGYMLIKGVSALMRANTIDG